MHTKNLYENGPNPFFFGTKNMSEGHLMHTVLVCYIFDKLGQAAYAGEVQQRNCRMEMCVCVCFLPIHSGHQVRWTYQPGSHRRKVTQDF